MLTQGSVASIDEQKDHPLVGSPVVVTTPCGTALSSMSGASSILSDPSSLVADVGEGLHLLQVDYQGAAEMTPCRTVPHEIASNQPASGFSFLSSQPCCNCQFCTSWPIQAGPTCNDAATLAGHYKILQCFCSHAFPVTYNWQVAPPLSHVENLLGRCCLLQSHYRLWCPQKFRATTALPNL